MWKAACLWLRSPRASSLLLSRTTSGTSRPAVHWLGRGEKCMKYSLLLTRNEKFILVCTFNLVLRRCMNHSCYSAPSLFHVPIPPWPAPSSSAPPGCARVLSGWCHGCVWDDALWLWSRVHRCSLVFFFCLQTNLNWRWGRGCLTEGPLLFPVMLTWADCCQDLILSSPIIYFKLVLNSEPKTKWDLLWRTVDNNRLMLFKKQITARFPFNKTEVNSRLGTVQRRILQLCVNLAHSGLAVLPDWLWWFLLPSLCVKSSISFNMVPAMECESEGGWWGLKHAEREGKNPKYAFFVESPLKCEVK